MINFKIDDMPDDERVYAIKLDLIQIFGREITVKATLANGESYYLISFKTDGTFYRHKNIPDCMGFQIEKNGRITRREND